jgi:Carboxypeptidase regulatory-like domain
MRRLGFIAFVLLGLAAFWLLPRESRKPAPAALPKPVHVPQQPAPAVAAPAPEAPREEGNVLFRVLDSAGHPLAGVPVRIWRRGSFDPGVARYRWVKQPGLRTGKDGTARTNLEAGAHYAAAHAPGRAPARKAFSQRAEVVLVAQAAVSLSGRVEDAASHEPIPLADLKLIPTAAELESAEPPDDEQAHVASGPDGRFTAAGLAPGSYVVEGQAAGYGRSRTPELEVPEPHLVVLLRAAAFVEGRVLLPDGTGAARAEITASHLRDPAVTEADAGGRFSLEVAPGSFLLSARSGELTARVTRPLAARAGSTLNVGTLQLQQGGALEVEVVDGKQAPVASAEVIVSPFGFDGTTGTAKTDERGHALVKGLPEGSYDLDILASGHDRYLQRGLVVAAAQTVSHKAVLAGQGAIEGTVRDESGNALEGALVRAQPLSSAFAPATALTTRTDAGGRYHLGGVAEGTAQVAALPEEQAAMGATRSVAVSAGEVTQLDLVAEASATISGHVDGAPSGKRVMVVARSEKALHSSLERAESPLDAGGRYSLKVPPGRWWVFPYHPAQLSESREDGKTVDVAAGQTLELDLAFDRSNDAVTGQVLEPGGAPASYASVVLRSQDRDQEHLQADEDGRFRVKHAREMPEGTRVIARKAGRSAEVPFGQGELVIQLHQGAAIHGRVTSDGQPAASFILSATPASAPGSYQISGSSFALDDISAGLVTVRCVLPNGISAEQQVTLQEGEDRRLDFDLVVAAHLRGRILEKTGGPLAGVNVRAFPNGEGAGISAVTSERGAFSMALPSRGLVVVGVILPGRRGMRHVQVDQDDLDLGDLTLEDDPGTQ